MPDRTVERAGPDSICAQLAAFGLLPKPVIYRRRKRRRTRWPAGDPVLLATPSENGKTLEAWCVYCHRVHTHARHGAIEDCGPDCPCQLHADPQGRHRCDCRLGSGDGHRVAHCAEGPFRRGGYWIREVAR
jgi:hypothetical protein